MISMAGAKTHHVKLGHLRFLNARSRTKTLESIWQNIEQSHALAIGHVVDIAFPIFESESSCP